MPKKIKRTPVTHPDIDRLPPHAAQFRMLREAQGITQEALEAELLAKYNEAREERSYRPTRGWISNLERGLVSLELLEKYPKRLDRIATVLKMTSADLRWELGVVTAEDVEEMYADLDAGPDELPFKMQQEALAGRAWMLMQSHRAVFRLGRPHLHDTATDDLEAEDVYGVVATRADAPEDHILVAVHDEAMRDAQGQGLLPGDILTVRLLPEGEQVRDGHLYVFRNAKKGGQDHVVRRAHLDGDQVWAQADHPDALSYRAIRVMPPKVRAVGEVIHVTRTTPVDTA